MLGASFTASSGITTEQLEHVKKPQLLNVPLSWHVSVRSLFEQLHKPSVAATACSGVSQSACSRSSPNLFSR